ncbi:ADP-ribosylation factor-binding protein GGA3a [Scleropages formosus]|uniref:Golgi associated, gamma adaptin ear containing, ARF binding protein 3a n=1 Tax=Scleropages formosus TaxID=113540 RepID=A0A8C9REQ4_SCLFO|nr:ADP-ribosylation factor-binding protein GGA3 [Scleropages formosus]
MADPEGESLESWLNKATNPSNRNEDWEYIIGFCDQINKELEGPQIAVRLLAHKIQSPQEWEAIQALTVLEACMKNCGRRFHNEVGKFRFLNELIKVVSPKYLGDRVSEKVKKKVIEMLFSWAVALPDEAKINEAYQMLKRQGIVTIDPEIPVDKTLIPSPPARPKNPVFDNEEKSKLLAELLKSKNPEDLQEANRLIKNMVKEDEARMQKVTKRVNTLEEVNNNVKLLNEMLNHFNRDESSEADKELIKELYDRCDKLRRTVFKLATETEDNDNSLGEILQASDDLSRVINSYKRTVEGQAVNGETDVLGTPGMEGSKGNQPTLIDLADLDVPTPSPPELAPAAQHPEPSTGSLLAPTIPVLPPPPYKLAVSQNFPVSQTDSPSHRTSTNHSSTALSILDEELLSLGLNDPVPGLNNQTLNVVDEEELNSVPTSSRVAPSSELDFFGSSALPGPMIPSVLPSVGPLQKTPVCQPEAPRTASFPFPSTTQSGSASLGQGLQDLAMLDLGDPKGMPGLMNQSSVFGMVSKTDPMASAASSSSSSTTASSGPGFPILNSVVSTLGPLPAGSAVSQAKTQAVSSSPGSPLFRSLSPILPPTQDSPAKAAEVSLANLYVPLDSIKPSKVLPVTAYDKDGVRVLLHFATDCPPGRPDVLVLVVSMLNTAPLPVRNVVLQAAVPKSMKVKLQPPSGTELAPFNPVLPPSSITQVMLLANPLKEKVRLRYKIMFSLGERQCTEVGEVDQFPPAEKWGNL